MDKSKRRLCGLAALAALFLLLLMLYLFGGAFHLVFLPPGEDAFTVEAEGIPDRLSPGEELSVRVRVKNQSPRAYRVVHTGAPVRIGICRRDGGEEPVRTGPAVSEVLWPGGVLEGGESFIPPEAAGGGGYVVAIQVDFSIEGLFGTKKYHYSLDYAVPAA
ncbi:MAG TPA: hypothetical protein H9684_00070 [Firmicutes bacterium]|nr:hypothetical protein [Bacillota bacterium]